MSAGKAKVNQLAQEIRDKGEEGWEVLKKTLQEEKKEMLQALHADPSLAVDLRGKMERLLREDVFRHKKSKKKPKGDFVKFLITHRGWNASRVRQILRERAVCREHRNPMEAEMIWVCERNVPPIGSWLLSHTQVQDKRAELEQWDQEHGTKEEKEQPAEKSCGCFHWIPGTTGADIWRGHACTSRVERFQSPFLRALLHKGHAFKAGKGEESLMSELTKGLEGYIDYKCKRDKNHAAYERWKQAVLTRVNVELQKGEVSLYPKGSQGQEEVKAMQKDLVFLKEDRAPHVVVAMCKYRYMLERERYLSPGNTFQVAEEAEEDILTRHKEFHLGKGLLPHDRLPYIYGIWKSAKKSLRWISGVRKAPNEAKGGNTGKPEGSIAGTGTELVGLL